MSSGLALPTRPDNLHAPFGVRIDSDVFHICERIKEVNKSLFVGVLDPPVQFAGKTYNFAVGEHCVDGQDRLVQRFEELDARVIKQIQYLLHVPFEKRLEEAEKLEAKREAERQEDEHAELYDRIGRPMLTDLERCGFAQRPTSYPKRGIKSR